MHIVLGWHRVDVLEIAIACLFLFGSELIIKQESVKRKRNYESQRQNVDERDNMVLVRDASTRRVAPCPIEGGAAVQTTGGRARARPPNASSRVGQWPGNGGNGPCMC